jgi:magnesium transporter
MSDDVWIDLTDPDETALATAIPVEVHRAAFRRILAQPRHDDDPRPRIEAQGDYLFGVLVVPLFVPEDVRVIYQEIDVLATRDRLVTVCKTPPGGTPYDVGNLRAAAVQSGAGPGYCLYLLYDDVAEQFLSLVDAFDDDIDELEDRVEEWPPPRVRERISDLRHDILHVRRVLTPTRDTARCLVDNRIELDDLEGAEELFPKAVELHFADAYDKLLRATDGLDLSRDLLAGVRDYHQAQVANDQNEVMKRLTVVASVLLLPTFIVGLYGQNLKGAPEYGWGHGYLWSWFLIVATTAGQIVYFRRKRWI